MIRKGPQHQAGSDSLLTGETFFKLKEMYFENDIEEKRYSGFLYGLETAETGKSENDDDLAATSSTDTTAGNNRNRPNTTTNTSSLSVTNTTTNGAANIVSTSNGSNNSGTNDSIGNKTENDGNAV